MATAVPLKKTSAPEEENEFSFRELIVKSANYLPLFIIFIILSFAAALVYIHYQTPIYSTSVKLLIKDASKKSGSGGDIMLSDLVGTSKPNLANESEILKSHALMQRVVAHQQLNTVYYSIGKVNTLELFGTDTNSKFILFSSIKDSSRFYSIVIQVDADGSIYTINGKEKTKVQNHVPIISPLFTYVINIIDTKIYLPDHKYSATWIPTATMAAGLAGSIGVNPLSKDATILMISTSSQVPVKSQILLNSLVTEYNSYNIEQTNQIADNTIRFIDDRLLFITNELNTVENGIKDLKQNNALNLEAEGSQEIGTAKDIKEKLNDQELQMNVADMVSQYVNNSKRRFELVPSNLGIGDLTLSGLVASYNEGVLKRQEMLKTMGEKNLDVLTLESQLDDMRGKIIESINNIKAVYNNAYNAAYSQYKSTLNNISSIPAKEKELLEIERQQGIKEKLYLYLLQKKEETAVSRAAATGKSDSIDDAQSSGPINIKNSNVYLMALFAGLGFPLLIVYLMDLLNDKLTTRQEILKFTEAPIIGEISHFEDQERKIIAGKTRGVLPEQFRIVRTNLRYFLPKEKTGDCILVTSTMPGEGKTFVSMNLAAVLAAPGKKTVLIEFDMRRPKISEALGLPKENTDLAAFLSGNIDPAKIIRKTDQAENVYVITTSYVPPNPAELLLSERISILFDYLKKNFDYIVVDTPPLGIVSDAKVLAEYANLSIYVIRQRFTQRKQVKMLDDIYREKRLPNLALVVNDVKAKGIRGYYGYGYYNTGNYGYDYSVGYGYSYSNKAKKQNGNNSLRFSGNGYSSIMKVSTKKKLIQLICKKRLQPVMQKFYLLGLTGMNFGTANILEPEDTGEEWVIKYIAKKLKNEPNITIFDVGANTGNYALLVLANFKSNIPVIYAFEPSKQTYTILKKNTAKYSQIKPINLGLGEKEETQTIYANFQGSGATTLYENALIHTTLQNLSEEVKLTSIDSFCASYGIPKINFLKADVEGHELPVLLGAISMIKAKRIQFIQFEFGAFHVYSKTFFKYFWDFLSPLYKIYRVLTDGIFEIKSYNENLEIFRTVNFYAELK